MAVERAAVPRDWADSDYSRIYHTVVDDPKFADIYHNDAAWAAYTRLLMYADQTYPARPPVPAWVKPSALKKLTDGGVVSVSSGHYSIVGLPKEREARFGAGKGRPRYPSDGPKPVRPDSDSTPTPLRSHSDAGDDPESTRAAVGAVRSASTYNSDSSSTGGAGGSDRWAAPEAPVLAYLASVGATVAPDGNGYHREVSRLVERLGAPAVIAEMERLHAAGQRSARQLIYGAANRLEPIARAGPKPKGIGANDDFGSATEIV